MRGLSRDYAHLTEILPPRCTRRDDIPASACLGLLQGTNMCPCGFSNVYPQYVANYS